MILSKGFQIIKGFLLGFIKGQAVNEDRLREENILFFQVGQPFFELRHTKAFGFEGHYKSMGQDGLPEFV